MSVPQSSSCIVKSKPLSLLYNAKHNAGGSPDSKQQTQASFPGQTLRHCMALFRLHKPIHASISPWLTSNVLTLSATSFLQENVRRHQFTALYQEKGTMWANNSSSHGSFSWGTLCERAGTWQPTRSSDWHFPHIGPQQPPHAPAQPSLTWEAKDTQSLALTYRRGERIVCMWLYQEKSGYQGGEVGQGDTTTRSRSLSPRLL